MKKSKLLFITSLEDSHSDYVINLLNQSDKAEKVVRLNTEYFIDNCLVTFTEQGFIIEIKDSNKVISNDEIFSVWYRRPKEFNFQIPDEDLTNFIHKQANSLLRGLYFSTHDTAKWINPLPSLHRARIKLQQLTLARKIGFNIPKTLATNNPGKVLDFIQAIDHVSTKSLDEPSYQTARHIYPIFNKKLKKEFIAANKDSIAVCPTLLQEYIEKKSDIRVVVIGNQVFAFEIHSQENQLSIEDFRGVSPSNLKHTPVQLPLFLEEMIFEFLQKQELIYSSLDFVRSTSDEYYFIENNPNGQWLWLELQTGIKISESFISALTN